jgi:hypothetical protein
LLEANVSATRAATGERVWWWLWVVVGVGEGLSWNRAIQSSTPATQRCDKHVKRQPGSLKIAYHDRHARHGDK